jgi:hypothetical protein
MLPIDQDEDGNLIYADGVEPYVIRTSERTNFKKCRQYWDFTSQLRNNLESTRMNHNLAFGIAVHVGMEHFYLPEEYHQDLLLRTNSAVVAFVEENDRQKRAEEEATGGISDERVEEYEERAVLGAGMLRRYAEWADPQDKELGLKPIAVEWKFQIPVYDRWSNPLIVNGRPVVYQLRVDMVAEHGDGTVWIWDHKTAGALGDIDHLELDIQLSSYMWALAVKTGKPVSGFMYNELEKKVPHPPKVNKNGTLSQDKRQLTTHQLYTEAIEELGLDPGPYSDMLEHLQANERDYFRRTPVRRSARELAVQGEYVVAEARDMLSGPSIYPNPGKFNCGGCDFRPPCAIRMEGNDASFTLGDPTLFRSRDAQDEVDANTI